MHNVAYLSGNGNINLSNGVLAEGTNANTMKTTAAIDFAIDGVLYSKAATDNIALTACAAQADLTSCMYVILVKSDASVVTRKGTEQKTGSGLPMFWPAIPSDEVVIGAIKVANSGGTFTAGSVDLGAATVTDTYYNFMQLPARPYLA